MHRDRPRSPATGLAGLLCEEGHTLQSEEKIALPVSPKQPIYETRLPVLSELFPYLCRYLCEMFKQSPPSFLAQYTLERLGQVTVKSPNQNASLKLAIRPLGYLLRIPQGGRSETFDLEYDAGHRFPNLTKTNPFRSYDICLIYTARGV